jgi:hypothetical protein
LGSLLCSVIFLCSRSLRNNCVLCCYVSCFGECAVDYANCCPVVYFFVVLTCRARSRAYLQLFWMIIPLVTQIGFNTNLLFCSHVLRCRAFHSFQLWYCYLCFVREYYLLFGVVCSVTWVSICVFFVRFCLPVSTLCDNSSVFGEFSASLGFAKPGYLLVGSLLA